MEQFIGRVLGDRYRIESVLGGQVGRRTFLAYDLQTGLSVVVKLLLFSPDFTWEYLKLFEREAEVLKSLDHPAIPQYLDDFEVEMEWGKGKAFVQTYIEAPSLLKWIESGRTFSQVDLETIAKQLLEILDYLHRRQPPVIHRDIKPSNVLLGDRSGHSVGQVYLIDLGSVQTVVHGGTRTIVGTYGYMPPEQFGGQTTSASDLYALGATLIYLATGQHPDQLPQQQMRIGFENRVHLSLNVIDWLKSMTEPSVELRFQSAKQALEALENTDFRKNQLFVTKPTGSKVIVTKTEEMLEIFIPPRGFDLSLIFLIPLAIVWNSFTASLLWDMLSNFSWTGLFFGLVFFTFFSIPGLSMIAYIPFSLFGVTTLRITPAKISLISKIFGVQYGQPFIGHRSDITKVELSPVSYQKDSDGNPVKVHPKINIWVGVKKWTLNTINGLTPPEIDWLAHELSDWLNLPISRG
ncbi:serine/threonine-protein kinase [Limnoraphis robusta Tam1]|uniref:Serine/threonine-protein kinase n=1 Tax=Limnoraphis robusta CCNP1315 TaxID=3110306 RepID=A0ABU5U3I8_9CYAN|nr:serine/threonine-protein kinase [Limnoraphis robusta]MEA5498388.1 serine/threonine-protein kinase [Limnoraphis robusta BA-68 BA1]MEA5521580.1 serine/threonine-protein kinase [Limnoraphis robusta CCNP1315]MEA5540413.1 serine/threonine-protein kinase [Limnoraphis robusta Tam1]MEA5544216.1 serine/threonine-protein kinase [Limnoraphis robusta CCNP1324]